MPLDIFESKATNLHRSEAPRRTREDLLAETLAEYSRVDEPRQREILQGVIKHVHMLAAEINLTLDEWLQAMEFLKETGKTCTEDRQEFILLSDLLGLSALVELQDRHAQPPETPGSVVGPLHAEGSPFIENGGSINLDQVPGGQTAYVYGTVTGVEGEPIPGAVFDIWQTAPNALYAVLDEGQSEFNLRGKLRADELGRYGFYTVKPVPYTVPRDGPCGHILRASDRHGMRAAHIHIGLEADGYKGLITEIFPSDDPYLENDTVFGACEALQMDYVTNTGPNIDAELTARFDFVLRKL